MSYITGKLSRRGMNFLTKKGIGYTFTYEEFYNETNMMFGLSTVWLKSAINEGLVQKTKDEDYKILRLEASLEKWR